MLSLTQNMFFVEKDALVGLSLSFRILTTGTILPEPTTQLLIIFVQVLFSFDFFDDFIENIYIGRTLNKFG